MNSAARAEQHLSISPKHPMRRIGRGVFVAAVIGTFVMGMGAVGSAATATGSTSAHVNVATAITLTGLTTNFTLSGIPGANPATNGAVVMNVETNNLAGYNVTVESAAATMTPPVHTIVNPDSIPIAALTVRETGTTPYLAMSATGPVTVHAQATRSAQGGDNLSNDYTLAIPFVNQDIYTATLDYVATTL
jgi:hypothetical protein